MKLYLLRHGKTIWNVEERFQGQLDSPLTEDGIQKIKKTAKKLENVKFEKIYTSEMNRTIDTAKILVENSKIAENKKIELVKMSELNEIHFGNWQGMTYKEIYEKYPKNGNNYFNNPKKYNPKENNGEDLFDGLKRFLKGIMKIVQENQDLEGNILVVTHGTVIELFLNYIDNKSVHDLDERKLIGNAEYKIYEYMEDKFVEI